MAQPQWFPIFASNAAPFLDGSTKSGAIGAEAKVSITIDTYPELIYGVRFAVSYEIPAATFGLAPAFKQQMREGGVDDDFTVTVELTQQKITTGSSTHVRNFQGALGINLHPLPVPYPVRGGNRFEFSGRRTSSYPQLRIDDLILNIEPSLYVTILAARGVLSVADNVSGPAAAGSTGFPRSE
jgi:hypothetical protein